MNLENKSLVPRNVVQRGSLPVAVGITIVLWLAYTALQTLFLTLQLDEVLVAVLEYIPGILGIGVLLASGLSREECHLRLTWPSWKGLLVLVAFSLLWPFILSTGRWIGWNWQAALVQGAGGISQELFFRAALLPALLALFTNRRFLALVLHAALFAVWHAGAFLITPPQLIAGPIAIVTVSLVAGLVWGWQTMHDQTVIWAIVHHSLLWLIGSMFYLGPS
ncbi:MAG TPA: CPBP family glutamic-type intramembrane protease [Anaerolineae bacterium]